MIGQINTRCSAIQAIAHIAINALYLAIVCSLITLASADNSAKDADFPEGFPISEFSADDVSRRNKSILSNDNDINHEKTSIYIKTSEGLTLWKIANHISSAKNIDVNQVMLVLLNENPKSFDEYNINSMRAKTVLAFPDEPHFTLSNNEAAAEIQRQHTQWSHRNSMAQQTDTSVDDSSMSINENSLVDQEEILHELQLQSSDDGRPQAHHTLVVPASNWENLPEVSNESISEHEKIDQSDDSAGALIDNEQVSVAYERDAIELSWDLQMLMALSDRLRSELSQVSDQQLLSNGVVNLKYYFYQTTQYHKQWLIVFLIMLSVILLGLMVGRNQRRNQFRNQFINEAPEQLFVQRAENKIDSLPEMIWTDRDYVLAKITHQAVASDVETDIKSNFADLYSSESMLAEFDSQESLISTGSVLSARDLVIAQIAARRRNVEKEETDVSQVKWLSSAEIIERAKVLMAYGKYAQAIADLQLTLQHDSEDIAVKCQLAEAYCLNHQTQDFLLLAEDLQPCLQVNSLEWKKLQGYAYRIVPEHSGFEFDSSIIQLEVEKQPSQVDAQKHEPSNVANDSFLDTDNITDNDSVNSVEQDDDFVIEDCATQLDLAKAYIAMGNTEQAQQALNAVINLGDESQRQQAYQLIVQLANS